MKIIKDLDLTNYNSYKIHSTAAIALFPESEQDLREIISNYDVSSAYILGKGCNSIFAKKYYPVSQPIIFIRENYSGICQHGNQLEVLAGTDLEELSIYAMKHSFAGLEYFYDIPGCVGGAITMNAGSCGISFSDYIESVKYLDCNTRDVRILKKEEIETGYRNSIFKNNNNFFIISCVLELPKGDQVDILNKMEEIKKKRFFKQPREYPNAGSVFVRPKEDLYVGPMIEKLNLKGYRIGDAEISTKHAGFIVNRGNATGEDIVKLITYIQEKVQKHFGVSLKTEQRILL